MGMLKFVAIKKKLKNENFYKTMALTLNLIELIKILIVTNDIKGIKRFISEGEDINLQDEEGWTALITATFYNDPEIVKILIDAGAKIDLQNNEGKTALDIAKEYDYQEIVELLTTNK